MSPDRAPWRWPQTTEELRAPFDAAPAFMVGIEEEVMLLDPETLELAHRASQVLEATAGDPRFKLELPASQLEILTAPLATVPEAAVALLDARRDLVAAAGENVSFAGAGAHPFSPGAGELNDGERYARVINDYRGVARHELVCAFQVHVSVGSSERALAVHNAARSYLPLLAALAAAAPFYEAVDTGLASVRPVICGLLPRQGIPPSIPSWDSYRETLAWGRAADAFPDPASYWWELRLNPRFGTLEFRVPDAQASVADGAAVAAVAQALVAWLGARHDAGEELDVDPDWRIAQNRWFACRDGITGELADLKTGERTKTRDLCHELLETLAPAAKELQSTGELDDARALAEANGAIAHREIASEGGPRAVARWLTERFLQAGRG